MKKRRSWSDDEKREICQQTMPPGVSVAQVARRYAMNANMVYTFPSRGPAGIDHDERGKAIQSGRYEWMRDVHNRHR